MRSTGTIPERHSAGIDEPWRIRYCTTRMAQVAAQPNGAVLPPSEIGDVTAATKDMKLSNGDDLPASTTGLPSASIDELKLPLSAAEGLIKKPFAAPLATAKPSPHPPLTTDQEKKYNELLQRVLTWTSLPTSSTRLSSESPLTDSERLFLTRECLLRYLRATTWNTGQAETRLKATLVWRREYGVEKLTSDYVEIESRTGTLLAENQ